MQRLRPLLAGIALVVLACLGTGAVAAARPRAAAQGTDRHLAMAAGAFTDSVGVNVPTGDAAAGWAVAQRLQAAGIRHVRGPAATGPDDPALEGLRALAGADLQLDLVLGDRADPEAAAATAASLGPAVAALEAPAGRNAARLRRAVAAHPRLPGVAVLGSGPGADYQAVRLELGGRCPGCAGDQLGSGDGAVQVTEAVLGAGVPDAVAARYLPRLLLANAGLAVRTYLPGVGGDAGPGLLTPAGAPTPAYHAVARLLALLDDGPGQHQPGHLGFRLDGNADGVQHRLLQKADGHFWLALWVERPGWDPAAGRELTVPAQQVTVALDKPVAGARAFVPEVGTTAQHSFTDPPGAGRELDSVELEVTDRVLLLELLPAPAGGAASKATRPPAAAAPAAPPSQSPVVKGPGQTATPTTGPAADGTRVAADGQPAAALDPASRSPLAFTGATAVSMLAASLLLLVVGVAALLASRRRYHPRH
jgi:serralysin